MPPLNITSMNNQDLVPGTRQRADQHLCTDWQLFVGDIVAFREGHGWHQVTQVRRRKCSQELGVSLRCLQTGQTIRKIWTASGFVATWGVVPAIFAPVAAADNASVKLQALFRGRLARRRQPSPPSATRGELTSIPASTQLWRSSELSHARALPSPEPSTPSPTRLNSWGSTPAGPATISSLHSPPIDAKSEPMAKQAAQSALPLASPAQPTTMPQPQLSRVPTSRACAVNEKSSNIKGSEATRARRKRRRRAYNKKGHDRNTESSCSNNRRARRARDPAVRARREAYWVRRYPELAAPPPSSAPAVQLAQLQAPEVDQRQGTEWGREGKRTYSIEQMLALRPSPTSQLCPAAPLFVPYASRYSCLARAVRLGVADPPIGLVWKRPIISAAARQFCLSVHALLL